MMGTRVNYIIINDLKDNTFYANIIVDAYWMKKEIDARPSDAIALALRSKAPVYVKKSILDKAAVQPEHDMW
jgi:bifunctional DNase/RNase